MDVEISQTGVYTVKGGKSQVVLTLKSPARGSPEPEE